MIKQPKYVKKIIYTNEQITNAVKKTMIEQIRIDYAKKNPVIIGILKGCYMFLAELSKHIDFKHEIDFLTVSTFQGKVERSKTIKLVMDINIDITNRNVLLIDDVADYGQTLAYLFDHLKAKKPKEIKSFVLINKELNRPKKIEADYKCLSVENVFLLGYGLDYKENYRNLPYIAEFNHDVLKT